MFLISFPVKISLTFSCAFTNVNPLSPKHKPRHRIKDNNFNKYKFKNTVY